MPENRRGDIFDSHCTHIVEYVTSENA